MTKTVDAARPSDSASKYSPEPSLVLGCVGVGYFVVQVLLLTFDNAQPKFLMLVIFSASASFSLGLFFLIVGIIGLVRNE